MELFKKCLICKKLIFKRKLNYGITRWKKVQYCSNRCSAFSKGEGRVNVKCGQCSKKFSALVSFRKVGHHKFCSKKCHEIYQRGKRVSIETEFRKGDNLNEKNSLWKGDDVSYSGVHYWIARRKGRAIKCEHCGKIAVKKCFHWANIDHKYKRDVDDFIALCPSCHKIYDFKNKLVSVFVGRPK